jgi:hypothetical protein
MQARILFGVLIGLLLEGSFRTYWGAGLFSYSSGCSAAAAGSLACGLVTN